MRRARAASPALSPVGSSDASDAALTFETVDIRRVVCDGAPLLRSGGEVRTHVLVCVCPRTSLAVTNAVTHTRPLCAQEYQYETNLSPEQRKVQAIRQRRLLLRRISGSTDPIWTTREDSLAQQMLPRLTADRTLARSGGVKCMCACVSEWPRDSCVRLLSGADVKDIADDIERSEERAPDTRAPPQTKKRTAAELLDVERRRHTKASTGSSASAKKLKVEDAATTCTEDGGNEDDALAQLQIVADLVADLFESVFSAKWEVRHGALLALRQVFLASQLTQALTATFASASLASTHAWLKECLVRCICVLALDQFVDYSADGSVSPVREVCAQVFGVLLGNLQSDARVLVGYLEILRALFRGATWHACHGALLGLKYLVLAHKTHAPTLLPLFYADVLEAFTTRRGAGGEDDDVLVLAAEMFETFTPFLEQIPAPQLQETATLLWTLLTEHVASSGLVPATAVQALSAWYNHTQVRTVLDADARLAALTTASLHHIVPLLHDPMRTVRHAALTCAAAMFQAHDNDSERSNRRSTQLIELPFVRYLLPHMLLQLLRETDDDLRDDALAAWRRIVQTSAHANVLVAAIADSVASWVDLIWSVAEAKGLDVAYCSAGDANKRRERAVSMDVDASSTARVAFADAIAYLAAHVPLASSPSDVIVSKLNASLCSASAERQCGALLTISQWAVYEKQQLQQQCSDRDGEAPDAAAPPSQRLTALQDALGAALTTLARQDWIVVSNDLYYSEQRSLLRRVRVMEERIVGVFTTHGIACEAARSVSRSAAEASRCIAEHVAALPYDQLLAAQPEAFERAHFARQDLFLVDETLQQSFARFYHRVQGLGSCAYSNLLAVPAKKSGFLVKALMDAIKQEESDVFQRLTAQSLAAFVVSQASVQRKCVAKIGSNLCHSAVALAVTDVEAGGSSAGDSLDSGAAVTATSESDVLRRARVRVRGAENALTTICEFAGERVFDICLSLHESVAKAWTAHPRDDQIVVQSAHLAQTVVSAVDTRAFATCLDWLREFAGLVTQPLGLETTRTALARTIASICRHAKTHQESAMVVVYERVFAVVAGRSEPTALRGAMLVLHHVARALSSDLMPYVPSLVRYAMKAMSSQDSATRSLAARAFADLVPLVPLQMDLRESRSTQSEALRAIVGENEVSRAFLESLLEGKAVKHVDVAHVLAPGVALRSYQQHGVDWLSFLVENSLHGILADDMGLGKTLQTLAAIAASLKKTTTPSDASSQCCLVVCPPVVTHHWVTEAIARLADVFTSVVDYSGSLPDRKLLRKSMATASSSAPGPSLIVTTYLVLRSDIAFLKQTDYAFVVLDEAHLIRNPATSLFSAVQQLSAVHRVALSGTPLQNNVGDLWTLFEFLMPGYLGDLATFRRECVLPISRSRTRHATPKQKEVAALAISRLHERVLPFILRRTKGQVLTELPPKIISNVLATMTPIQRKLYAWACGSQRVPSTDDDSDDAAARKPVASVLANLHVLRRICVHPALVAKDAGALQQLTAKEATAAKQWESSGKLLALRDVLIDACDLGRREASSGASKGDVALSDDDSVVSAQHRCLIFAQLQETLNVVQDMLASALPGVTYRRLDGQTPPSRRAAIIQQFNDDVSIDVLLLTTAVGGLGLTLTGADTVIFMEHSWNPFVDLQAMDRAHRIGQRRTVRVFRLIVRESLEEHIMDLQAFKERVATTVVAETNAQSSMSGSTTEVLSLLQSSSSTVTAKALARDRKEAAPKRVPYLPAGAQELLGQLGEFWDESQYNSLAFPEHDDESEQ